MTMRVFEVCSLACLLAVGALTSAMADNSLPRAAPYPSAQTPAAVDLGALQVRAPATSISVTVALALPDLEAAENLLASVSTPGDPQYHHFLTAEEFTARFAPTKSTVAGVVAALEKYGLTAEQTTATTLRVTGMPADIERAFAVSLHSYEVPAHGAAASYTYHAPLSHATIPAEISGSVSAVVGLDTRPSLHPMNMHAPKAALGHPQPAAGKAGDPFGSLTVADFADLYDVQPLYKRGVT
jgi:kumamolisin